MTNAEMFEKSFQRPQNYFKLSGEQQWNEDGRLGILDWDGSCPHKHMEMCPDCYKRFTDFYNNKEIKKEDLNPITKADKHTLIALMNGLKQSAMSSGQYPTPFTPERYDSRVKSEAFRCMGYNRKVRQIGALERLLK